MVNPSPRLDACLELCRQCRDVCQDTLYNYCLTPEVKHTEPSHTRAMSDCIDMCQVACNFMQRASPHMAEVCRLCAVVCESCAQSCEQYEDERMKICADLCRECAASCTAMEDA